MMGHTSRTLAAVFMLAACAKRDAAPKPAPAAASSAPTCEQAADATMAISTTHLRAAFEGLSPDELAATRDGVIDQCRVHPWDEEERRCVVAAAKAGGDAVAAVARCHRR